MADDKKNIPEAAPPAEAPSPAVEKAAVPEQPAPEPISAVFVKDLSRLGRNYIEVGKLTEEFFPLHDIRLVAVSDGVDSDEGEDDFTPFKNIMKNISHSGKVSNDFSLFGRF